MSVEAAPASASLEIERKYDVGPAQDVPDLSDVTGVDSVAPAVDYLLEATYYDTADLRLRGAKITLRHRTGGVDAGWHLKLPAGADREELAVDAPAGGVPETLAALVRAHVRRAALVPVARLTTRRRVVRLLGPHGDPLAEIADDQVSGQPLPTGTVLVWREWEVELLGGERALLDAVQVRLIEAGAALSTSASKLGRVIRAPRAEGPLPWWAKRDAASPPTAAAAVQAHLGEQVRELIARDPQVRRDVPDTVHKMRVATRRLRSALATFRPLLRREQTDPLRDELRWLASVLGAPRDAEVMHARLRALVAAEEPDLVLGPVQARIEVVMGARYRAAHEALVAALDGDRYLQLLDALDALVASPPFLDEARGDATEVLPRLVRRTWKRLHRVMTAAERAERGPAQNALLHEVRKDAKRARYAAESVQPVFGRPAGRFAAAMEDLQESLGDFQDGVVTREVLRELGATGHRSGENGFTFGRLHALEQVRAEAAVAAWPRTRKSASRRGLRRWFEH